jgi:hypothetical protein
MPSYLKKNSKKKIWAKINDYNKTVYAR